MKISEQLASFDRSRAVRFRVRSLVAVAAVVWGVMLLDAAQAPQPTDRLGVLNAQLERGETSLEYREPFGYLQSLLEHLGIGTDAQSLVFSKTSLQQALITPKNPRALYFNDNVAVGYVPGGEVFELVALEPSHGLAFYTLDTQRTERPRLQSRNDCFFCHGLGNKGAAALIVATVFPDETGLPAYTSTFIDTIDHRAPFDQRWGGWYVTGTHGSQKHLGNAVATDPLRPLDLIGRDSQNLTSLEGRFDLKKYPAPSSDLVALMTLEHQVGAANRMNAAVLQYNRLKRDGLTEADWTEIDADLANLVGYLLFVDEAPLTEPVKGTSTFAQSFAARGPRDKRGRSLREFDLERRLFRYPLSYMVYSDLFDSLPGPIGERVYRRLYDVLTAKESSGAYRGLSAADRQTILEILLDTKPNLPEYWKTGVTGTAAG
jgi:hypothetical protein